MGLVCLLGFAFPDISVGGHPSDLLLKPHIHLPHLIAETTHLLLPPLHQRPHLLERRLRLGLADHARPAEQAPESRPDPLHCCSILRRTRPLRPRLVQITDMSLLLTRPSSSFPLPPVPLPAEHGPLVVPARSVPLHTAQLRLEPFFFLFQLTSRPIKLPHLLLHRPLSPSHLNDNPFKLRHPPPPPAHFFLELLCASPPLRLGSFGSLNPRDLLLRSRLSFTRKSFESPHFPRHDARPMLHELSSQARLAVSKH